MTAPSEPPSFVALLRASAWLLLLALLLGLLAFGLWRAWIWLGF